MKFSVLKFHISQVLRLVYILTESTCVLFLVLTPKQIIACSEVDDRLQI